MVGRPSMRTNTAASTVQELRMTHWLLADVSWSRSGVSGLFLYCARPAFWPGVGAKGLAVWRGSACIPLAAGWGCPAWRRARCLGKWSEIRESRLDKRVPLPRRGRTCDGSDVGRVRVTAVGPGSLGALRSTCWNRVDRNRGPPIFGGSVADDAVDVTSPAVQRSGVLSRARGPST